MSDKRSCIHCGHAEDAHVDTRGMKGQRQVPWCNDCNSNHIAAHSFHPFMNTERGATFEELDPSSGRYHGHTGGGPNYAGKQWVHQHDGGNMEHEHFRQGVHTRDYHATGYQENVPDKLPPDIRDKDINKSLSDMHSHEDDEQEGAKFHGAHQHLFEEADDHYHTSASGEDVPLSPHKVPGHYCSSCGGASAPRAKAKCGRTDAHTAHGVGHDFCVGNMGNPIAGRPAASPVPDKVPKTWARIKPKKEYPPEITARARYVPGKREAEIGKRVDTILALRHKFHGTATDRMGKSADGGDCKTCGHELEYHPQKSSTAGDSGCTLCACDTYKRERTCVDCQHGVSEHNSTHAYDSQGTIETGCDKCKCIKYREPSVGRWAKPRARKIATDKRLDTVMALRQKWHGSGHSIIDKSMAEGEKHLDFPESGADLYNHMLTGHGRGTKTGWHLFSGSVDLEHPRVKAQLHKLHLGDHEKSKRPFVAKAARRLTLSKARHNTFCVDCGHLASEHDFPSAPSDANGGCGHLFESAQDAPKGTPRRYTIPDHCSGGFRERGEHSWNCKRQLGESPPGHVQCMCARAEEGIEHSGFPICGCGHAMESHHYPIERAATNGNFCNRGGCSCEGYHEKTKIPEQLPSDIRDMKIDKSHDGGPGPSWDIHTTNEWHGPDCKLTEGKRGGVKFHVERWRRNGATKTWKTRPGEFRIPVKQGLKNYGYIDHTDHLYYHPADRCPEEARHETALQVRATNKLPDDIANMKIDKSRRAFCPDCGHMRCLGKCADCPSCAKGVGRVIGPNDNTHSHADDGFDLYHGTHDHPYSEQSPHEHEPDYGLEHCENCGHIWNHQKDPIPSTCAECPTCRRPPTRINVPDKLPDDIRDRDVNKSQARCSGCGTAVTPATADTCRHGTYCMSCFGAHGDKEDGNYTTCPERDKKGFVCTRNPKHQGDHVAHSWGGKIESQWSQSALTLSGPRHCRECKADLTGMKAVDIGKHMGGHPEGRRTVISGLKAGYGDLPDRARIEPAKGARHRSVPCAFGSHDMCTNRGRMTRRDRPKVLCDCKCHPQVTDKLPDDIRDMNIEKGAQHDRVWHEHARAESFAHFHDVDQDGNIKYSDHGHTDAERADVRERALQQFGKREAKDIPDHLPPDIRDKDLGKSVWRLRKGNDYCGADSDESPEVAEEKLSHGTETSSPAEFASTCKKRGSYSGLLAPSGKVYARPGYQEHENMIDQAHMHHDYHGLVNAHGWARLSTKGANMNIDFNHDVMSRDTAARLHQVASIHGRVNGWTCYGRHRGGWEAGRDGASLAEHLEEEASQKSFRLTQASAGKPPKQTRPHANDRGEWNGKRFWSGSVSRIDGRVEEVHPFRTAQNYDFHHRMYMSPGAIERIDHGDSAFFHIDDRDHKPQLWSTAEDGSGFGSAVTPGLNKDQLRGHIERQVKIHP